jgi:hypothetical protein
MINSGCYQGILFSVTEWDLLKGIEVAKKQEPKVLHVSITQGIIALLAG